MDTLNQLFNLLDKIQGWPIAALTFSVCIAVGYVLKLIPKFPNDGIPLAVVLFGVLVYMMLVDPHPNEMTLRQWSTRNSCVGFLLGVLAWGAHKLIISRLEDLLIQWFPFLGKLLIKPDPCADTPNSGNKKDP